VGAPLVSGGPISFTFGPSFGPFTFVLFTNALAPTVVTTWGGAVVEKGWWRWISGDLEK
jgi:hypothetical protein